jgi:hypothetical protein
MLNAEQMRSLPLCFTTIAADVPPGETRQEAGE